MSNKQELIEAVAFFDEFVNAVLRKEADSFDALSVVKHYNTVKGELAKLTVPEKE